MKDDLEDVDWIPTKLRGRKKKGKDESR